MSRAPARSASPQRIAMIAACPFPSPRGSQVLIRELAQNLADRGHAVHLVTYPHGESLVPIHGIHVHRVRPPGFLSLPGHLGWRRVILDAWLAVTLYRVVRDQQIDVIHAHNYEGPLVAYLVRWLTGVPVVYHSHNALSDELAYYVAPGWRRTVAHRLGRFLDRQIPRRADFSVALTPELEGFLRAHGVAANRVAVVPPGAATGVATEGRADEADLFRGRFVVMYTGNLDPYQDLDVLCDGFARLRQSVACPLLVLVTHEANWSERISDSLACALREGHAEVIFAPAFSVVRRLMARADVLVCPRSSWSGFPIKLVNYLSMGRPVVVAEGSAKAVIDGETGLVFRNRDAQHLALALRRLSDDAALRTQLGENARLASAKWDGWKQVVIQIERIFAEVAHRARADGAEAGVGRGGKPRGLIAFSRGRISAASRRQSG